MRLSVGTMTGTSMDAVDAAAVEITGHGLEMSATLQCIASEPLGSLRPHLQALSLQDPLPETDAAVAASMLGELTAAAIKQLHLRHIDLIALHGQTVLHRPPKSVQLIDPAPIVSEFDCTVLTDPRQGDLALGGQGAPITPLADWVMFRSTTDDTAIVNLGGFCNVTILPSKCSPEDIRGLDVCCCNLILDALAKARIGEAFDRGGAVALRGDVDRASAQSLAHRLRQQHDEGRSLGSGDDLGRWAVTLTAHLEARHALATAADAIGGVIAAAIEDTTSILFAGGGSQNRRLRSAIEAALGRSVQVTDAHGVPVQAREAMAMAILGALHLDGIPTTLPHITGRRSDAPLEGWVQASP